MDRSGFTLIEVVMAMVLLGFVLLGAQAVITDRLLGNVGRQSARTTALQLVTDRLQVVQTEPRYSELRSRFNAVENAIPHFPHYRRTTVVTQQADHTIVTVQVITPTGADTVAGTAVIGMP